MRGATMVAAALVGLLTVACARTDGASDEERWGAHRASERLLVAAASDLQAALEPLVAHYQEETGEGVEILLGSTGNLARQIRHGAPVDLFLSADASFLDALIADGYVSPESRREYAVGRLAVVVPPGSGQAPPLRALAQSDYTVIAIANPEHAPYGRIAREALESAGIWDQVEERIVFAEGVSHALQFVRTGNADVGLVAVGLLPGGGLDLPWARPLLGDTEPLLRQVAGVPTGSAREGASLRFLDFLESSEGQEILASFGFEPPGPKRVLPERDE